METPRAVYIDLSCPSTNLCCHKVSKDFYNCLVSLAGGVLGQLDDRAGHPLHVANLGR